MKCAGGCNRELGRRAASAAGWTARPAGLTCQQCAREQDAAVRKMVHHAPPPRLVGLLLAAALACFPVASWCQAEPDPPDHPSTPSSPAPAAAPASPGGGSSVVAGAAIWAGQDGKVDRGLAYPVARWHALTDPNHKAFAEVVALVGGEGAGLGVARETYSLTQGDVRTSVAVGLGAVVPYSPDAGGQRTRFRLVLFGVVSVGSAK